LARPGPPPARHPVTAGCRASCAGEVHDAAALCARVNHLIGRTRSPGCAAILAYSEVAPRGGFADRLLDEQTEPWVRTSFEGPGTWRLWNLRSSSRVHAFLKQRLAERTHQSKRDPGPAEAGVNPRPTVARHRTSRFSTRAIHRDD
jgi:hypothetical protein